LGVYAFATTTVGYGWGWVVVMGVVGLAAGIGMPYGYMPALLYAGMVPTMATQVVGLRDAILSAVFAVLGGLIGVLTGRRLGMKAEVPGKANWIGYEWVSGAIVAGLFVIGTSIAVATGLPHGYWVALTLIVVIPPIVQGDDTKRGRERLIGTVAGLAIIIPISLIPLPEWAFYVIGFILLIPAFVVMQKSYTYYAFFESAAVVMLVSAGNDLIGLDAARVEAQVIGVTLVAVAALGIAWGVKHVSSSDVSKKAIAS
ncbi:MAG: FUSC family protein, partial [Actinomycetota bacterium]